MAFNAEFLAYPQIARIALGIRYREKVGRNCSTVILAKRVTDVMA